MKPHRLVLENLESRQLLAAHSHAEAIEAWIIMNYPNDFMDNTLPPFLSDSSRHSHQGANETDSHEVPSKLPANHVNQIFAGAFETIGSF